MIFVLLVQRQLPTQLPSHSCLETVILVLSLMPPGVKDLIVKVTLGNFPWIFGFGWVWLEFQLGLNLGRLTNNRT